MGFMEMGVRAGMGSSKEGGVQGGKASWDWSLRDGFRDVGDGGCLRH